MKICSKCNIEKDESEFHKDRYRLDGFRCYCKECVKHQTDLYYQENKEQVLEYSKQYRQEHKEERGEYDHQYRQKNKDRLREKRQRRYEGHKESRKRQRNFRYETDVIFRLRQIVSSSVYRILKLNRGKKNGSVLEFLPYTVEQLRNHLEERFEPWMNWENHGVYAVGGERKWQIDHITPHSSFHYETMDCEEFRKCWALENLQPLGAIENIKKGNNK